MLLLKKKICIIFGKINKIIVSPVQRFIVKITKFDIKSNVVNIEFFTMMIKLQPSLVQKYYNHNKIINDRYLIA